GVHRVVASSFGSGAVPSRAPRRMAASVTVRAIGPALSWSAVIGITPQRLIRPTVGLMAASIETFDGPRMDPDVSVPTLAAHRFAAVPLPELDPAGVSAPRPSAVSGRGSRRGS